MCGSSRGRERSPAVSGPLPRPPHALPLCPQPGTPTAGARPQCPAPAASPAAPRNFPRRPRPRPRPRPQRARSRAPDLHQWRSRKLASRLPHTLSEPGPAGRWAGRDGRSFLLPASGPAVSWEWESDPWGIGEAGDGCGPGLPALIRSERAGGRVWRVAPCFRASALRALPARARRGRGGSECGCPGRACRKREPEELALSKWGNRGEPGGLALCPAQGAPLAFLAEKSLSLPEIS